MRIGVVFPQTEIGADRGAIREYTLRAEALGFTHLLINVREMSRLAPSYPVLPWASPEGRNRFVELTRLLGKPVVLEGSIVVYDLGEPTAGAR